jgi:mannosyltransferase OCH1-like enzyme
MAIPKIIHQLWIGKKPAPTKFMNTWRDAHVPLGWEYRLWNEAEIVHNVDIGRYARRVNSIEEINGKADVFRWIILQKYGGVFVDADSICIEPFDSHILADGVDAFAGWEQEQVRKGLAATGTMGFTPSHPIVNSALEWIARNPISNRDTGNRAWFTVGPGLLTRICQMYDFKNITMYPSHYFLPFHYSGIKYEGHEKIYAYQEWGSTKQNYDVMNQVELPIILSKSSPREKVSILMSSLNSKQSYLNECITSIKRQTGNFDIQLVIVNDGSDEEHTKILHDSCHLFEMTSRFCTVKLIENETNMGLGYSLNIGVQQCDNEIILRMDTDDIMYDDRIIKQITYLKNNTCALCGAQVSIFNNDNINNVAMQTKHKSIEWDDYKKHEHMQSNHWMMNHPTYCFRRSKVLEVGNYNANIHSMVEDFDLMLRMLKTHGKIHNMPDVLLHYRLHPGQVTNAAGDPKWKRVREEIIADMVKTS